LFQNPVGFEQALGKTGQKPGFSTKFKEAVPKTEVLEQPHFPKIKFLGKPLVARIFFHHERFGPVSW
jgi:hypothetical protein